MTPSNEHKNPTEAAAMIDVVLRREKNWEELWFYQKTVVLYQLTYTFTSRFLPKYGDRTVDQMIQAARSGKQNIVEGMAVYASSLSDPSLAVSLALGVGFHNIPLGMVISSSFYHSKQNKMTTMLSILIVSLSTDRKSVV